MAYKYSRRTILSSIQTIGLSTIAHNFGSIEDPLEELMNKSCPISTHFKHIFYKYTTKHVAMAKKQSNQVVFVNTEGNNDPFKLA